MLRRTILFSVTTTAVLVVAFLLLGHQADRLEIAGDSYQRIELKVNSYTTSAQSHISLDMDEEGNLVTVWDSRRQDRGTYGVFARWVDPSGIPRGPEEQVNLRQESMQERPAVSLAENGDAWFAWQSFGQDGESGSIISRMTGDESIVNETTAGDQANVAVDRLGDGTWVATWSGTGAGSSDPGISYRLFGADGAPASEEIAIDTPEGCIDRLPSVAECGDGGFVLAWARSSLGEPSSSIYACRFDREGNARSLPIHVDTADGLAIEPSVAGNRAGEFAVAWLEFSETSDYDVMVRRFDAQATALGSPVLANSDAIGWRSGAAVALTDDGRCLVAWSRFTEEDLDSDLYARLYDSDGQALSDEFVVNGFTNGKQSLPAATGTRRIAMTQDGRMAFAWDGDSGNNDPTAANVTILVPEGSGFAGDVASAVRYGRMLFASLAPERPVRMNTAATPYVPPTFDGSERGPLLDPDSLVLTEVGIGFTAFTNTGWTPPDPHMAAGSNHVMGTVNGGLVAYQKDGTLVWVEDISGAGGFWGEVGATSFVFDPEVIFDPYENRFIAMANERGSDNHSYFLVGVSSTDDPSDEWYKYRLDVTTLAGNDIDSPNIAVDTDAVYLTADFFTGGQKYLIYIIEKSSILNGGSPVTTSVLRTGSQSFGIPVMYTDDAPNMYMIEHFENEPATSVRLWAVLDPLGSPSITSFTLNVPAYYRPGDLRSQGTSVRPETFDSRFWSCMYGNGSIWAAHHVALDNSPRVTVARWYEIEMNGWPVSGDDPTLRQSGSVAPPDDVYCSFNSICADGSGNALMLFTRSSVNEYFSMARVFRTSSDPLGMMSAPESVKESGVVYTRNRWGDYSAVVPDPVDAGTFWMHNEYAAAGNNWHTWIASEQVVDPASVSPILEGSMARLTISPNPTVGQATLAFDLLRSSEVTMEILDVGGRRILQKQLGFLEGRNQQIGWDGLDQNGTRVNNGVYLVRIVAGGQIVSSGRVVVSK